MTDMTNFNDFLNEQLKNPEFKKEYDALEGKIIIKAPTHGRVKTLLDCVVELSKDDSCTVILKEEKKKTLQIYTPKRQRK